MSEWPALTLAIDCGSTNFKAALFDQALTRLAEDAVPVEYLTQDDTVVEFSTEAIWEHTRTLIRRLTDSVGVPTTAISRIGLTSQAQTFTLLDAQGQALMPFVSWLDHRGTAESERVRQGLGADFHRHSSFPQPNEQLTLPKLLWARRRLGGRFDQAARLVTLPGFLAFRLAGRNLLDRNIGSMCGLVDLRTGNYWRDALELVEFPSRLLPELVDVGAAAAREAAATDLPLAENVLVVPAGNDQTAGGYANRCHEGTLLVTLGTALVAYRFAGLEPGPYSPQGAWGPYPGGGFYELGVSDFGCRALDRARRYLLPEAGIEAFENLLARAKAPDADTPWFYPERAGRDDAWQGHPDAAQRAWAVLEGITFALHGLIYDDMGVGAPPATVSVTGGGSRNQRWLQIIADVLGCATVAVAGDSLLGAAMMAHPETAAPATACGQHYQPDADRHRRAQRRLAAWRQQRRS